MKTARPTPHRLVRVPARSARQAGAALVVSLILLLVLTLIGVTGMRSSSMEEKMAGNMRDRNVAFQSAESGVRTGEKWIADRTDPPPTTVNPGHTLSGSINVYAPEATLPELAVQTQAWWNSDNNALAGELLQDSSGDDLVAEQPRYVLQYLDFRPDSFDVGVEEPTGRHFYRVTGHGTGVSTTARAVVQTTFVKRFN
jgi:type IV pilus assembly protein PilX